MQEQLMSLGQSAKFLGVSERKMWKLLKEGKVNYRQDPLDKRRKLFKLSELKKLKEESL
jgi:phage antirepressor YoqD-like protein